MLFIGSDQARYAPFSLSTRNTTTTSFLPTRMSFCTDLIRLLDNSESKIIPSVLSYSSCEELGVYTSECGDRILPA